MPSSTLATVPRSARTLGERLAAATATVPSAAANVGDDTIHRWRRTLDRQEPGRFERRLRWDGLDEATVRAALGAEPDAVSTDVVTADVDWTTLLDAVAAVSALPDDGRIVRDDAPVPFEELLLPFVDVARRRLRDAVPTLDRLLAPDVRHALERALLRELSAAAEQALLADFSVARARRGAHTLFGAPARTVYREFVTTLRAERLAPLFERYPVLARLLAVRAAFWVRSTADLVRRAHADAAALGALFGGGHPGPVASIDVGRGDTHGGGRTVATVRYASGLTVMYKPRSMAIDLAFHGLLDWLREAGLAPDQRTLKVLDRGDYGWAEFVRPEPVADAGALHDYYERAGALVCLSYVLGAGDLHAENLIAVGAYPVVVDLEMMMCAPVDAARAARAGRGGDEPAAIAPSPVNALSSLLLPFWNVGPDGALLFRGGGLGIENDALRTSVRRWRDVNTDRMRREAVTEPLPVGTNVPYLDGRPVPPGAYTADIVRGFERCHALLEARCETLVAAGGALARFRGCRVRVMVRDTRVYGTTLRASLHPSCLAAGVERSLQLEVLRASVLSNEERVAHWPAFDAEQRDLESLDVPLFWARTDETALFDARGTPVGEYCAVSGYDQAMDRLARLDAADRRHQASLVRFIYAYERGPVATIAAPRHVPNAPAAPDDGGALDAADAVAEARAIATALEALVVRDDDGSAQWVGVDREQKAPTLGLRPLRERFYDGRAGVALFLAALDAVGATGHTALAADAMRPLRAALRDPRTSATLPDTMGIGAGLGVGGIVYTLAQIARCSGDAAWLDDARRAAHAITPAHAAADTVLEVLGGTAGAALALLSLHDLTGEAWVLARAVACGRRLLAAAEMEPATGCRVWRLTHGAFATGFAHGAGGIGAALARLAAATGDDAFARAARDAFTFETRIADGHAGAHLAAVVAKVDRRSPWRQTWCNGPIGVATARARYDGAAPAEIVAEASTLALSTAPDHACCGTMGRVELLLAAGHDAQARALAGLVVARARRARSYHISRDVPDARYAPAFHQGLAGIGYQLLRIADTDRLRSALVFA